MGGGREAQKQREEEEGKRWKSLMSCRKEKREEWN
jgi:hypothetical protein